MARSRIGLVGALGGFVDVRDTVPWCLTRVEAVVLSVSRAMNRRHVGVALGLLVVGGVAVAGARAASTMRPRAWTRRPAVTVVAAEGEPRIGAVREAVDFWNRTFAEIGTPFRLGEVTVVTGSVPDQDVQGLGEQVLRRTWWPTMPASLERFPGDLIVVLSDARFISFTARRGGRVVIGIKDRNAPPLTLPNVMRNVVAHELGHAVGLEHDQDPALLMCGRPAPCRPDAFRSETPRFFPLSAGEKAHLLELYRRDWTAR